MQLLIWLVRVLIVLLIVWFAAKNAEPAVLHGLLGGQWQAPMALILLAFFGAGLLLGLVAALLTIFQLKREIRKLNRALQHKVREDAARESAREGAPAGALLPQPPPSGVAGSH